MSKKNLKDQIAFSEQHAASDQLDTSTFRVNVDFPKWAVESLDRESKRLGISRQSLIRIWVVEKLDLESKK